MAMSSDRLLHCPAPRPMTVDRRWGTTAEAAPNCPRCASANTKFCYYNNYSLSQPRYFCKGCRRYWTRGGSLRNVPVGGGCRKSRRSRSSKSSSGGSSVVLGPDQSSNESSEEAGGPNIDLAAVFAKFLNNDQNSNSNISDPINTPSEASHDSLTSSSNGLEPENGFETQTPSDHKLVQEEQEATQGLTCPDLASFDDIIEDIFWSDESNLSSLTWQPVNHLQDLDFPISCDNLNYFDTSGFEVFSKP